MHDQVGMRVGDGGEHIEEKADPRFYIELMLVAEPIDVVAFDIFEHEIGLPGRGDARVEELRDVRVREAAEHAALTFESLLTARESDTQELDRCPALEPSVATLREPHRAHPTLTDRRQQGVCADRLAYELCVAR